MDVVPNAIIRHAAGKSFSESRHEGVQLDAEQQEYLLPHFCMLIVGKPGSGKTYMIQRFLKDETMYKGKFDYIFLVSPSAKKIGLSIPKQRQSERFSLTWIYDKISFCNEEQAKRHSKADLKKAGGPTSMLAKKMAQARPEPQSNVKK